MNEPVKKMDQTPESYSPKIKPWIVNLVEKVTVEEAEEMKQNHSVKVAKLEYLYRERRDSQRPGCGKSIWTYVGKKRRNFFCFGSNGELRFLIKRQLRFNAS